MAEDEEEASTDGPKKPKKSKKSILLILAVVVLVGAAVVSGLDYRRLLPGGLFIAGLVLCQLWVPFAREATRVVNRLRDALPPPELPPPRFSPNR